MKTLILMILITLTFNAYSVNHRKDLLFGSDNTPAALDTISDSNQSDSTRTIVFHGDKQFRNADFKGSLTVFGHARKISGTAAAIAVQIRLLLDATASPPEYSDYFDLGTIDSGDLVPYSFAVSRQSFWTFCDGYEVTYILPDAVAREYEIKAKGKYK